MVKQTRKSAKSKTARAKKIAVVMLNLGGPDCKNAIRPFLMNFFMDKNIIQLPVPFRCILAWWIAKKRSRREAGESYGEIGDNSPLLANSRKQAKALDLALKQSKGGIYKSFICMRYWHPMSPQVVREVRDWGADEILVLPLYPQFSTTTTWSSLQVLHKALYDAGMEDVPVSTICCYPYNDGFIAASADNIVKEYRRAVKDGHKAPRVLFSAHGLPEKIIKAGDPYQYQCEQSAKRIAKAVKAKLKLKTLDWQICYQSRVGRLKWIGPSTEEAIQSAADDGKAVVIYPHAFTQEHVETLVELDIEYREEAEKMGQQGYYRAATVGTHPKFINGLAGLVKKHAGRKKVEAEGYKNICPSNAVNCCMRRGDDLAVRGA